VLMRWRKPCVLARLRVLGWKVCLLTSCSIDRRQQWVPLTAVPVAAGQAEPPSSSLPRTDGVVRSPLLRRGEHGEVHTEPARTGAWTRNTGHSIVGAPPDAGQTAVARLTQSTRVRTEGERRVSSIRHPLLTDLCTAPVNKAVHKRHGCDFHTVLH
jgi:hypothetical protein